MAQQVIGIFELVPDRALRVASPRDAGCDLHSSCYTCPYVDCVKDDPQRAERLEYQTRLRRARRLRERGKTISEIALRLNVSRRTVFRLLRPKSLWAVGIN